MEYVSAITGIGAVGLGFLAAVIALRNGGLREDAANARHLQIAAERDLELTAKELADHRSKTDELLKYYRAEIESLEESIADLATAGAGDVRDHIRRVLSEGSSG